MSKSNGLHKKNGAHSVRWNFRSSDDVKEFWKKFQRVPARKHRSKRDEERYCLALYLLALATYRKLKYPLRVEEGDSPDFIITWSSGKSTGLEVKKVRGMWVEGEMTNGDPSSSWLREMRGAVERRLLDIGSFRSTSRRDLLIYYDAPLPAIDRAKVLPVLSRWLSETRNANPSLGRISMIVSLDLLLDSGDELKVLPFINWSNPEATSDFGERIEYIGEKAVSTAVRKHKQEGRPIHYTDSRGRLVKEMPDGTRYEVRVEPNGNEVVIGELVRE